MVALNNHVFRGKNESITCDVFNLETAADRMKKYFSIIAVSKANQRAHFKVIHPSSNYGMEGKVLFNYMLCFKKFNGPFDC